MSVDEAIIIVWVLAQTYLGFRLVKVAPPQSIKAKYTKAVLLQSMIPFMTRWKAKLQPDDGLLFDEFRRHLFVFFVTLILASASYKLYIYIKYIYLR